MKRFIKYILLLAVLPLQAVSQTLIPSRNGGFIFPEKNSASQDVPDDEEDVYFILSGEADKAIAEGDYETAQARIMEALSIDRDNPSNVLLLSNLGMIYSYLGNDSLALQVLNEALSRAPAMTTVINNRAMVYMQLGDDSKAYSEFARTIEIDSLNADARYYHGIVSLYTGDVSAAEADFAVLRSVSPESLNTATALASLYSLTGRDREALPYYRRLVKDDPSPEYYTALADIHLRLDDLSEAAAVIAEGMELFPADPDMYLCRARLNKARFRYEDAKADEQMAKRLRK